MADRKLKISETKYRRLFEAAQDGILIVNALTGQIEDANPFLETLLGYSRLEFLNKKLWEVGPFKNIIKSQASFKKLQDDKYARYSDLPLETKDGRTIEVEFVANVYGIDHEQVIQCNIRDMTAAHDAKKLAKEHTESVEKWNQLMVGREDKMADLKTENADLKKENKRLSDIESEREEK